MSHRALRKPSTLVIVSLVLATLAGCASKGRGDPKAAGAQRGTRAAIETCEEAAERKEILTLGWDDAAAARFSARAKVGVVPVSFSGCALEVVEACQGNFGTYDATAPSGTLPADMAQVLREEGSAYRFFPLGGRQAKAEIGAGEQPKLVYKTFGGGSATGKRPAKIPLSKIAGCATVTHFVTGFSVGAAAVELTKGSETRVGLHQGSLAACGATGTDGGSCKEPVRLFLTVVPAADAADEAAAKSLLASAKAKEARDAKGCLADLDARAALAAEDVEARLVRASCLMLAGECDAGTSLYESVRRESGAPAAEAQKDASDLANRQCSAASAKAPRDVVARLERDALEIAKKGDGKACTSAFDTLEAAIDKLPPAEAKEADKLGSFVGMHLSACAATLSCDAGFALYKRFLLRALNPPGTKSPLRLAGDQRDRPRYEEFLKKRDVVCK